MANSTHTGSGKTVVVIDSGWSPTWETAASVVYQHDYADNDGDARNPNADTHGALVTSRILSQAPDVGIIALKVMPDNSTTASGAAIEQALQWVVAHASDHNVVGVNLSLAGGSASSEMTTILSDELASLAAKRVLVSAAAGNAGQNGTATDVSYFAADHNTICVTASTGDGALPGWAQRNPGITDLCADGTDIRLTDLAGRTVTANGSSFAAPTVTAAVALAQQEALALRGSALTQDEFLSLAKQTGTPLGATGYTDLNTQAMLAKIGQLYGAPETPGTGPGAPATTAATILVNAKGTAAAGVNAHFTLLVDGQAVGSATVGSAAKTYAFTTSVSADSAHKVQIRYDNDGFAGGQDRNLFVDSVSVNGHGYAATDAAVTYDKGALDGRDVVKGQSGMWWNGTLVVVADKSLFGTKAPSQAQLAELQAGDLLGHAVSANAASHGIADGAGWTPELLPAFEDAAHGLHAWYDAHDMAA
ncbi:S8 family serine peptidase [Azospirillum sp. INR13]|uniref:carbohydrate-binding domain-containing protein n=1 Tax=Azospirillum sp. INR13 TaxID=2596919 RepID=UPI0018921E28|nr:S8 family serine peptidase [Azospirillum sp. INR13]